MCLCRSMQIKTHGPNNNIKCHKAVTQVPPHTRTQTHTRPHYVVGTVPRTLSRHRKRKSLPERVKSVNHTSQPYTSSYMCTCCLAVTTTRHAAGASLRTTTANPVHDTVGDDSGSCWHWIQPTASLIPHRSPAETNGQDVGASSGGECESLPSAVTPVCVCVCSHFNRRICDSSAYTMN